LPTPVTDRADRPERRIAVNRGLTGRLLQFDEDHSGLGGADVLSVVFLGG
jgi:hypothetical protein